MSSRRARVPGAVRLEQIASRCLVELVVDREVGEVEERVAHARVLPVDDAQPLAVVEEVRVQEVVVTRPRCRASPRPLDARGQLVRPLEVRGHVAAALECGRAIGLDDAERVEGAGNRRALVEGAERGGHAGEEVRLAHPLGGRGRSLDEAGHEPALGLDERHHLWADPERGCGLRRLELDRPVDAEQVRVLAGDPQHERLAVDLDLQVVVGDAAAEDLDAHLASRPDALDGRLEPAHARIRSPDGS